MTAAGATAATVSAVGGGAAAGDIATLALMGSISCASKAVKNVTGGMDWILQPFGDWTNKSWGSLLSSLIVVPLALGLHRLAVFVGGKLPIKSLQKDAMTVMRFPGFTCDLGVIFAQGTLLNAMKQFYAKDKDAVGIVLGVVTYLILLTYGAWITWLHRHRGAMGIWYGKYLHAHKRVPKVFRPIVVPIGRWFPRICKYRYGSTINLWREDRLFFAYVPLASMTLNAIIAGFNADTPAQCDFQYIALGIVSVFQSVLIMIFWPFRHRVLNPITAATGVMVGFAIASPALPVIQAASAALVTAVTVASVFNAVFRMLLGTFERLKLKKWERELSEGEEPQRPKGEHARFDVEWDEEHLHEASKRPMLQTHDVDEDADPFADDDDKSKDRGALWRYASTVSAANHEDPLQAPMLKLADSFEEMIPVMEGSPKPLFPTASPPPVTAASTSLGRISSAAWSPQTRNGHRRVSNVNLPFDDDDL